MTTDLRKLKRAGVEPARVFGRRDFDPKASGAVWHYSLDGEDWFSPHYPTWMFKGTDCPVLAKAIQRYGVEEAPVTGRWVDFGQRLTGGPELGDRLLGEAEDYERSDGVIFPGYELEGVVIPATPVMYAYRRFGEDITFGSSDEMKVLRIHADGETVGIIRFIAADTVSAWTLAAVA